MFLKKKLFPEILFLFLISGVVYLPQIGNLSYYTDDWYYIYDSMVGGAKIFHEMFRIDRPARGYFFELYFSLIGNHPLPYHIGIYIWHGLSAVGALWIFDILWQNKQRFNFTAALLFLIYPGYFWWISAIEYQPMMASLALQVFSIAFTLKAVQSSRQILKIIFGVGAVLTGWIYIALVDYAIGMEGFRFLCIYLLVGRNSNLNFWNKLINTVKTWSWNFVIPAGFIVWRTFFFVNERRATDVGTQLGVFIERPLGTALEWTFRLYDSLLNISVLAWVSQFLSYLYGLRLRDTTIGLILVGVTLALFFLADRFIIKQSDESNNHNENQSKFRNEAFLLGGLGMLLGILPTIMANRYINIAGFSHYALPASLAAALFVTAFIASLSSKKSRTIVLYVIIGFATLSHYGIAYKVATDEAALKKFWWQVTWRAPSIREGTTLVVNYPISGMEGDGYGLMEIANVIYFPEPRDEVPVKYPLAGITPNDQNLPDILGTPFAQRTYRSHTVDFNYSNLLVITQPTTNSCVHVIDGNQPLISTYDTINVALVAPSSKIENILTQVDPVTPPNYIFGDEPEHDWCYYFQKADLAAQLGDWEKVVSLGDETFRLELSPEDRSEWLPFLKAYAITGNAEKLKALAKRIVGDKFLRQESCKWLSEIDLLLTEEVEQVIDEDYCKSG